jgi:spore maturation protein CgeB
MPIKIDVLMPSSSQYGVLHHFTKKLYEALQRQGAVCRLLSGDDMVLVPWKSLPDLTIGFNGSLQMEDGRFFPDLIKVPHVACLVDPPYRFLSLAESPHMIIACDDLEGCRLLKNRHFDRTVFMPHAVERDLKAGVERVYDIVFIGTCIDTEGRRKEWKKRFAPEICLLMQETAERTLADDSTSFIPILADRLDPAEHREVFEAVEMYIKGKDRLRVLEAFPDMRIDVFGADDGKAGWKKLLKRQSNIVVHPAVSFEESLKIMQQSRIVLNSSIKNKLGGHERIFAAAACGAVVVTNDNPWMREHFEAGKEILFYGPGVADEVAGLLADESKRGRIAEAGRKKVMQGHTWDHRAKQLLLDIAPMLG